MGFIDYLIIVVYLLAMLAIGLEQGENVPNLVQDPAQRLMKGANRCRASF